MANRGKVVDRTVYDTEKPSDKRAGKKNPSEMCPISTVQRLVREIREKVSRFAIFETK